MKFTDYLTEAFGDQIKGDEKAKQGKLLKDITKDLKSKSFKQLKFIKQFMDNN